MEIIVGKNAGFCYGVKRAVDGTFQELKNGKKVYCLGELIHNKKVVERLQDKGSILIENLSEVKEKNARVIIRAHGVAKEVYEEAEKREIELIDYSCPSVLKIHDIAKEYSQNGYFILLTCASKIHPEVIGIESFCGKNYALIENIEELENAVNQFKMNKVLLISQTTFNMKKFDEMERRLKEIIDANTDLVIQNTICNTTQIRQEETEKLAKEVDKMIIIGGKNSSNTKKLYEIALSQCKNTIFVETKEDLKDEDFSTTNKVGIMAGASTPQELIEELVKALS